ncbi:FTR1 family protein [Kineosporia sp. J2-2]|uniref:FTR1 family protein n=1 Tax=Kineosporia corallincola TaxID=2835133 RepID=A0ABS5TQ30_9ACTN|nr:iron uptake transporter permease EfeU [Kineosporia corallincola]MBT0773223.1 FTR1 family protein [Kineosporia corallincola]
MLPTFVIGLREGLEAALIVGIVAAFLTQRGRRDLLRWVYLGVATAVLLCVAAGIALELVSRELPQRRQEGLETVIGVFAVAMVSYMVVWMRRHSRDLKGDLEGAAGAALAQGSGWALVAMAFLAVIREGLETVVFLLAAFNESGSGRSAWIGALLGIVVSIVLGWAVFRGGIRLNLSRFFRITGVVLVLVAAGLVVSALHTAHEAGWVNWGQQSTLDLTAIVRPGSVQSSILTGMLGLQPRPVLVELAAWLVYLVPMLVYVAWPPNRVPGRATQIRLAAALAVTSAVAAVALLVLLPARPASRPVTTSGELSAQHLSGNRFQVAVPSGTSIGDTSDLSAARTLLPSATSTLTLEPGARTTRDGVTVQTFSEKDDEVPLTGPAELSYADLATANGGRLPLGVRGAGESGDGSVPVTYSATGELTLTVAADTGRVVDLVWSQGLTLTTTSSIGSVPVTAGTTTSRFDDADVAAALTAARSDTADREHRHTMTVTAVLLGLLAAAGALTASALATTRRRVAPVPEPEPAG